MDHCVCLLINLELHKLYLLKKNFSFVHIFNDIFFVKTNRSFGSNKFFFFTNGNIIMKISVIEIQFKLEVTVHEKKCLYKKGIRSEEGKFLKMSK